MFGLFKKKGIVRNDSNCTIDITENYITINGRNFEVPMHIDPLIEVLGTPRSIKFKTKEEDRKFLEGMHGEGMVTNRVNYVWDDLGLNCYTMNGKVLTCFGIELNHGETYPQTPKKIFTGKLTINGRHWLDAVKEGEDCEVLQHVYLGDYVITAEYVDFEQDMSTRDESSYTGIEISLKSGMDDMMSL